MEDGTSGNYTEIVEGGFLTAQELFALRNADGGSLKIGLKKTQPDGSEEEKAELQRLYGELKKQLSYPRIERISARSVASWDPERKVVKLLKKEGKFHSFGYTEDKTHFLEYYEALFLLELNRLELYFDSVLVSIEQAYVLLLGEERSKKYEEYFIYSTLCRAGYIVRKFNNLSFEVFLSEEDLVWAVLYSRLGREYQVPSYIKYSVEFQKTQESMDNIFNKIAKLTDEDVEKLNHDKKTASSSEDYIDLDRKFPAKRKVKEATDYRFQRKKCKIEINRTGESYLNVLKKEPEYEQFKKMFKEIEIINLREQDEYDEDCRELKVSFDIYLPSEPFRKSEPKPPILRAIILRSSENYPNRSELMKVYHNQKYKVPLIVISVSESKYTQAFLYYFT